VHHLFLPVGDADQVADLHLTEAQRGIAAADFPADLNDPRRLSHPAMADDAGGDAGFDEDFLEHDFHLFDVHDSPLSRGSATGRA